MPEPQEPQTSESWRPVFVSGKGFQQVHVAFFFWGESFFFFILRWRWYNKNRRIHDFLWPCCFWMGERGNKKFRTERIDGKKWDTQVFLSLFFVFIWQSQLLVINLNRFSREFRPVMPPALNSITYFQVLKDIVHQSRKKVLDLKNFFDIYTYYIFKSSKLGYSVNKTATPISFQTFRQQTLDIMLYISNISGHQGKQTNTSIYVFDWWKYCWEHLVHGNR